MGENAEKYLTFSVLIEKELGNGKSIKYEIKFIDSFTFMPSLVSDLVDNIFPTDGVTLNAQIVSLFLNIYQLKKMNY